MAKKLTVAERDARALVRKAAATRKRRSEAAKKAHARKRRKAGILPKGESERRSEAAKKGWQTRRKKREPLLDAAEQHAILTLGMMPRFKAGKIRQYLDKLPTAELAKVPLLTLRQWQQLASKPPTKAYGINPFWYRG